MLEDDTTAGETFELYGPREYSMTEIAGLVDREIIKHRRHINLPKRILKPAAKLLNQAIWWPTMSADEVEREFIDQSIDPKAKTFKDLDIEPGDLADFTFAYLVCTGLWTPQSVPLLTTSVLEQQDYRSSSYYDLPPATEREKREEKKFLHVIDDQ